MHGPMFPWVLSSNFAAGSMRVASEAEGIPLWVWPVLALMIGFLVWWWLRKPVEEVSSSVQTQRPEDDSMPSVLPLKTDLPLAPSRARRMARKVFDKPTPRLSTAESSAPPELEEFRFQKIPVVPPMVVKPDDLSIVEGVGPKINQVLHAAGIQSLFQLSECEGDYLKEILSTAGLKLVDPTTWPQQARLAIAGDLENLKALQATLRGGHRV